MLFWDDNYNFSFEYSLPNRYNLRQSCLDSFFMSRREVMSTMKDKKSWCRDRSD